MELSAIFTWIVSQGGAMFLAHALMERINFLKKIPDMLWKRAAAFAIAGAIASGIFALSIVFEYAASPVGWRDWVEQLVSVATTAIGFSQLLHAARHDRARKE